MWFGDRHPIEETLASFEAEKKQLSDNDIMQQTLEQFGEDERKFEFNDLTKLSETANVDLIRIHVGALIANFAFATAFAIFDNYPAAGVSCIPMLLYLGAWVFNSSIFYESFFNESSHRKLIEQARELEKSESGVHRLSSTTIIDSAEIVEDQIYDKASNKL